MSLYSTLFISVLIFSIMPLINKILNSCMLNAKESRLVKFLTSSIFCIFPLNWVHRTNCLNLTNTLTMNLTIFLRVVKVQLTKSVFLLKMLPILIFIYLKGFFWLSLQLQFICTLQPYFRGSSSSLEFGKLTFKLKLHFMQSIFCNNAKIRLNFFKIYQGFKAVHQVLSITLWCFTSFIAN